MMRFLQACVARLLEAVARLSASGSGSWSVYQAKVPESLNRPKGK